MIKVNDLVKHDISKQEFLKLNNIDNICEFIKNIIEKSYESRDADLLDDIMFILFEFEVYENIYIDLLHSLLLEYWHFKHEDIIWLLEHFSCEASIPVIYKALYYHPDYLNDDTFSYQKKCVRAIYQIGKEKSKKILEDIYYDSDGVVKMIAKRQIDKILGFNS